jgi:hypothetical protein
MAWSRVCSLKWGGRDPFIVIGVVAVVGCIGLATSLFAAHQGLFDQQSVLWESSRVCVSS